MSPSVKADRPATPLPNSYWVEPGRLLAGEYPGSQSRADALDRIKRLLEAGVNYFLDLTEPGELPAYDPLLPTGKSAGGRHVIYMRQPIRDHSVPEAPAAMAEILDHLDRALAAGHCVYVHCRAGIGRTGTVLGCHLVHRGLASDEALQKLNVLWQNCERSALWPQTPETDEQYRYVLNWRGTPLPPIDEQGLRAARTLRDRYLGCMLGLAIGDALGTAVQYRKPGSFTPVADLLGGGPFQLPRGAWTDDTAMALCLAESLVACGGADAADQIHRYQRWQREGYLSSTGQCVGITAGVAQALATARWTGKPYAGSHDPARLDKEALTRLAPVALYFLPAAGEAIRQAAEAARTTHQSPVILDACQFFTSLLVGALQGSGKAQLLSGTFLPNGADGIVRPWKPEVEAVACGSFKHKVPPQIEGGGTVLQALEAVLWALQRSGNFRDGALLAVNLGLDADVTGALYGQLAGALYGVSGIPANWRIAVLQRELIEERADQLLAAALEKLA